MNNIVTHSLSLFNTMTVDNNKVHNVKTLYNYKGVNAIVKFTDGLEYKVTVEPITGDDNGGN